MPFYTASTTTEHDALATFLEQHANQIRLTAMDLTDEQARRTHAPSALSIAGLIAHCTQVIAAWFERINVAPDEVRVEQLIALGKRLDMGDAMYSGGEVPDAPFEKVLATYDRVVASIRPTIEAADLEARIPVPDEPWYPEELESWNVRYVCLHLITEVARHAGHADLIREAIDGEIAYSLNAKADGEEWDWAAYRGEE